MSFTGRIDRRVYIYSQIALVPLLYLAGALCAGAVSALDPTFPTTHLPSFFKMTTMSSAGATTLAWASGIAVVLLLIAEISFTVRRLHDLDFSGWFFLLWPVLSYFSGDGTDAGTIIEAILTLVPGIAGPNDYGEDPRPRAVAARAASTSPAA